MTTVPRTSRVRDHRPRAGKVPRPRQPVDPGSTDVDGVGGPRAVAGWPGQSLPGRAAPARAVEPVVESLPLVVRRRTIPEPQLVRTGAAAVLGMLLMAALLGTVGGVVLFWVGTTLLQYVR